MQALARVRDIIIFGDRAKSSPFDLGHELAASAELVTDGGFELSNGDRRICHRDILLRQ
jgi:hypothetical protein